MTEKEQEKLAIERIWRTKILNKVESDIIRREDELKQLKAKRKALIGGKALPVIDQGEHNRFKWYCTQCDGLAGMNILASAIPFAADSVCVACKGRSSHDLMAIAKEE